MTLNEKLDRYSLMLGSVFYSALPLSMTFAIVLALGLSGCSFGPRSLQVQNAFEMLRIERDAVEDEYYLLKQKHDEALWRIEDLESEIETLRDGNVSRSRPATPTQDTGVEELEPLTGYPEDQVSTTVGFSESVSTGSVSYVELDPQLTRGFDSQGKSGDDGIVVVMRPRNSSDGFEAAAGEVTISLIDPARTGIRQRVGLWRFNGQQVTSRLDNRAEAYVFRLPWQRSIPKNSDLKLFVRFQTPDGKLESEMDLKVVLDGQPHSRWTALPGKASAPQVAQVDTEASLNNRPNESFVTPATETGETTAEVDTGPVKIARPQWSPYR